MTNSFQRTIYVISLLLAVSGCQTTHNTFPISSDQTTQAQTQEITYKDSRDKQLLAHYDRFAHTVSLSFNGERVILERTRSASGEKYSNESLIFWTKGNSALLTEDGTTLFRGTVVDN